MIPTVLDIADTPCDRLPPLVHVPPVTRPFDVTVRPPGSKSITNRALLLAALAEGESVLTGALVDADDAQVMIRALRQLGAEIETAPEVENVGGVVESCGNATVRVKGVAGRWKIAAGQTVTLNLNNAGTATRFLTAAAVLAPPESGGIIIDGNARMRQRPVGELVEALRRVGVRAEYLGAPGCVPVRVLAMPGVGGEQRTVRFGRTLSSQFISAVLLIAPFLGDGLAVEFLSEAHGSGASGEASASPAEVTSMSYVGMTLNVLAEVGVSFSGWPPKAVAVPPGMVDGFTLAVEPDASAATYLAAAAAMCPSSAARILGVPAFNEDALQEDALFSEVLSGFTGSLDAVEHGGGELRVRGGKELRPVTWHLRGMPDTAMTAAAVACFANGPSRLDGVGTLRVKETDRIQALITELGKIGVDAAADSFVHAGVADESLHIRPPAGGMDCSASAPRVEFDTYDDHRMAMSLALVGLRRPNVYLRDPGCVRKTYPTFWRDLAKVYR